MSAGPRRTYDDDPGLHALIRMSDAYTATDRALAARLGIDRDTITKYRSGARRPKRAVLERVVAEAERKAAELQAFASEVRAVLAARGPLRRSRAPRESSAEAPEPGSEDGSTGASPHAASGDHVGGQGANSSAAEAALERAGRYARSGDVVAAISSLREATEADDSPAIRDRVYGALAEMLYRSEAQSGPVILLAEALWADRAESPTAYARAQYWAGQAAERAGDLVRACEFYGRAAVHWNAAKART